MPSVATLLFFIKFKLIKDLKSHALGVPATWKAFYALFTLASWAFDEDYILHSTIVARLIDLFTLLLFLDCAENILFSIT